MQTLLTYENWVSFTILSISLPTICPFQGHGDWGGVGGRGGGQGRASPRHHRAGEFPAPDASPSQGALEPFRDTNSPI